MGKVVLVGGGPLSRRAALARLETVPGFEAEAEGRAGFGTVGRVALGEGVACDLVLLPGEPSLRPLWRPFAQGAVGALVLLPAEGIGGLLEELMRGLRLPTVVCGPRPEAVPAELREGPGAASFQGPDPAEALRALLAGAGLDEKGLRARLDSPAPAPEGAVRGSGLGSRLAQRSPDHGARAEKPELMPA